MREEEIKLERVKKSCNITAKTSLVLEIILIVAAVACMLGAIILFSFSKEIDNGIAQTISQDNGVSTSDFASLESAKIGGLLSFSFDASKMIENGEYGKVLGSYCIIGMFVCAMVALVFDMLRRIFKAIKMSETPFDEYVIKKFKKLFIIICVEILLMTGLGEALLVALICWSIYNIFDYGYTLQKQFDETL